MSNEEFKSGFAAILGRPNSGKSTLLNALVGAKVSIISSVPQTTRHQVRGILNLENCQIVFVDTPGIHDFPDSLALHLNKVASKAITGIDLVLYVVDVGRPPGREEEQIVAMVSRAKAKVIMVLNKIDKGRSFLNDYVELWRRSVKGLKRDPLIYFIPVSALKKTNIDKLKNVISGQVPSGPPFYDPETLTDFPLKMRIADILREKLFQALKQDLPHSVAVNIRDIQDKAKVLYIQALIYVQRDSQKQIVIGKNAGALKKVGVLSRKEIEGICGKKAYIEIKVSVLKDWQKNPRVLKELGYWWA